MRISDLLTGVLLVLLILCAVCVNLTSSLLQASVLFMAYSSVMCIIAVGAGISGTLFLMTLRKIHAVDRERTHKEEQS